MPELITPHVRVHASFVAAMEEFAAEGRGSAHDNSMIGRDLQRGQWRTRENFALYVDRLVADSLEATRRPVGHVPSTTLWWVEQDEFLGRLSIRHRLNDGLLEYGGHIGYDVRETRRREGHASAMLAAALPIAHDLGINPALITCDEDNVASRRVIEKAGGVYDDTRGIKRRYWVPTGRP